MKIHFLGTTGYHPCETRHTACIMIPEFGLVLDAGTGMFRVRDLIQTDVLRILLSHVHLDHCVGITFLFDVLHEKPVKRVEVYAEAKKLDSLQQHLFSELLFPAIPDVAFIPYGESPLAWEGLSITTFPLRHPGGSVGFCLNLSGPEGTKKVAYVTDTVAAEDADYLPHIQNVDLLIHECYFADGWEERAELTGHSCLTPVCQVARNVNAGQLALVHINPLDEATRLLDLESARKVFPNLLIPNDRDVIEI